MTSAPLSPFEPTGFPPGRTPASARSPQGLLGASAAFERMVSDLRMPRAPMPVLLDGETG